MKFIETDPLPEPEPPEGGWQEPSCDWNTHKWVLEVEDGRANIGCVDPCDPSLFDPSKPRPVCLVDWQPEDFHTPEAILVELTFVNDSSPAGPWGPAEHGYHIEVRLP